jgi:membrane fusion protein (multidrug efflux system)
VEPGSATYYDEYPATVTALDQVDIRPQVSGYISHIFFREGQHVAKGDRLYAIDQQQYKAAYDQASANLDVARANLAKAQQDADRYQDLAKADAVARQTLEHAMADLQSARMQVAAVEANVKSVATNLRYSVIYAPFDCTMGISLTKVGSAVTAGQTLLATVSSDNPIAVDAAVDEKQISRFTALVEKKAPESDSTFTIILPDQTVYLYPGRLTFIDRAVDSQTGTIRIRIVFSNATGLLKPGLTCNLRVKASNNDKSLLIPYKAVVEQMGEYFVYVVTGEKVTQRKVDLGMKVNGKAIVKVGLQAGEQIVVEGVQKLRDNSPIVIPTAVSAASSQTASAK